MLFVIDVESVVNVYKERWEKMTISNIKTNYGEFPTLIHFERYFEDKISKAYRDGFEAGYKYKKEK